MNSWAMAVHRLPGRPVPVRAVTSGDRALPEAWPRTCYRASMSFQPPRLGTFVKIPPQARMAMQMRNRVGNRVGTKLAPAGALALVAAGLGGVAYFKNTDGYDTYGKVAIIAALVTAVVGGAMSLVKQEIGAPIAAGGLTLFMSKAAGYLGTWVNFHHVFDPLEVKLFVAAGVVGLIAAIIAVAGLAGEGVAPIGVVIALLAVVPPVCVAALLHIDDARPAATIGAIVGALVASAFIAIGASRGRLGGVISVMAAGVWLPAWIDLTKNYDDRNAASLAALLAVSVIIVLGLVLVALAIRGATVVEEDPDLITDSWPGEGDGAAATAPSPGIMVPNYSPPPAVANPRIGPVVRPVGQPVTPVPVPTNGQWADDPYGRYQHRYWNGKRWTDHVATNGITGLDPIEVEG